MEQLANRLIKLSESIDKAETEESEFKGQQKQILITLKKEHSVSSIDSAKNKMAKGKKELSELEKELEAEIKELEEKMKNVS